MPTVSAVRTVRGSLNRAGPIGGLTPHGSKGADRAVRRLAINLYNFCSCHLFSGRLAEPQDLRGPGFKIGQPYTPMPSRWDGGIACPQRAPLRTAPGQKLTFLQIDVLRCSICNSQIKFSPQPIADQMDHFEPIRVVGSFLRDDHPPCVAIRLYRNRCVRGKIGNFLHLHPDNGFEFGRRLAGLLHSAWSRFSVPRFGSSICAGFQSQRRHDDKVPGRARFRPCIFVQVDGGLFASENFRAGTAMGGIQRIFPPREKRVQKG
jgi:hypothetical protein